jgi:hypothetical protein
MSMGDLMAWRIGLLWTVCALLIQQATAASVTLTWEPSRDPGVVGYILYVGTTSGRYTMRFNVGNYRGTTVSGLQNGRTYFFAVSAYDRTGLESPLSSQVHTYIPRHRRGRDCRKL